MKIANQNNKVSPNKQAYSRHLIVLFIKNLVMPTENEYIMYEGKKVRFERNG